MSVREQEKIDGILNGMVSMIKELSLWEQKYVIRTLERMFWWEIIMDEGLTPKRIFEFYKKMDDLLETINKKD